MLRGTFRAVSEAEMPHAWRADNPIPIKQLRRLSIPYWCVRSGFGMREDDPRKHKRVTGPCLR
jgi:hypothetical protein